MKYTKYAFLALAISIMVPCISAHADTLSTYGAITVVTGSGGTPAWQLTSDTSGVGYAGLEDEITVALTPATLLQLSADFEFTTGTVGGGAPRFTIFDDSLNSAYIYFGTPTGGGGFADPNPGTNENTGNYASLTSSDLRVASNGFGGVSSPNTYETFADFVAASGNVDISYITLDLDGGFTGTQVANVSNFEVNGTTYNPSAASPVPEPSSLLLLGTGILGTGGAMWRRLKSSL